jgi:putative addiction module killer protein
VETKPLKLKTYKTEGGSEPFTDWLKSIRRLTDARSRVFTRLKRAEGGNLGDHRPVGEGVIELKIDFGTGYRIYLGIDRDKLILLLGGTKATQDEDIGTAIGFWRDYNA